ncbi:hypothetical protein DFO67_10450 [Modicisalibacter xianhensis]|uniref:Uncharacterized protein n=1 Tax=Modicisalibacter xianhensis TaxID=442341 RepID=A0A4R8G429_9GAMM|nr:hypothetical protein [Halomonas xianhensis]TDX30795.1 hypothetical protein DFO67_10450 [Halomonas xianhensis]
MSELKPISFERLGGLYECNEPGDASGTYYQAADAQDLIDELRAALDEAHTLARTWASYYQAIHELTAHHPRHAAILSKVEAALAKAKGEQP